MKKHIAPPATAEQIRQTLGITKEDIEVVEKVLRELEAEDEEFFSPSCGKTESGLPGYSLSKRDE